MFHSTATKCRKCEQRITGQRVLCIDCMQLPGIGAWLIERARIATTMYSDFIDQLPAPELQRWEVVQDHAASIDTLPASQQRTAAINFRKRLDLTAQTTDLFGIVTAMYIQYRETCLDVDNYAKLLWVVDYEKAKAFDEIRGISH